MSVKYAVLGLLAQRRGYGYDLVQRCEELHLKLALSQPRSLSRLIELTYEQEQARLERLEQHLGGAAFDELLASSPPWSAVASVMVRDAEIAHLQATVEWLRRIREAMRWLQERPEALRSRG